MAAAAAGAAAVLGVLLISAPGTSARFTSTASGQPLVITSGTISASVTGPITGTVSAGTASNGVVVASGTIGMVPGVQDETLTYTVANSSASASPANISSVRVVSSGITSAAAWTDIQPYLGVTVAINGGTATALPASAITAIGIDATIATSANIQPGSSASVVVRFDLPATASSGTVDLARALQGDRSIASIIAVAPVFVLTQTSLAAP